MLEAAANKLIELGSHHGWFKFSNLNSLDPVGREEMLDLVSQVVQEYVNELVTKQESIHDLEQLVTDVEEDRQKFLLRAEVAEAKVKRLETRVAKLKRDEQINFDGMLEADANAEAAERQRDEAFTAGAEAMREACAKTVWPYVRGLDDILRAIPISAQEGK